MSSQKLSKRRQPEITPTTTTSAQPVPTPVRQYAGKLPNCEKSNFHHVGKCHKLRCKNCNRKGHTTRYCGAPAKPNTSNSGVMMGQVCYNCGEPGHFERNCPRVKDGQEARFAKTPTQHITSTTDASIVQVCCTCGEMGPFKRDCPTEKNNEETGGF
ncbi:uncharacterized protein LOC111889848 [Lactuca sativa]|uniref:uncharacterized protein LOC111889848 n=1 Tax=Lactuca sativa TaxID=4236 RepID=UPI000CD91821|nr:uncharacterized protein LOC111889848 [Lactuca sativa]